LAGTDDNNFRLVTLSTSIGVASQETVVVFNDAAYFLASDGVYQWADNGIKCISDETVRSWFATDTYFNRALFAKAFAFIDPNRQAYRLFLVPVDDEDEMANTWVEFDLETQTWWGPHVTNAYEFKSVFELAGGAPPQFGMGSEVGEIIVDSDTRVDADAESITIDALTAPQHIGDPPITAYWGELVTEVAPQTSGFLEVTPTVGEVDTPASTTLVHEMTEASRRLGRLGVGRFVQLQFTHDTWDEIVELRGYEINPTHAIGRR
jgi:hypothetical protein